MPGFDNFFHQDLTLFHAVPTLFAADPTFPGPAINFANLKILLQFRLLDPLISSFPRLNHAWIQLFSFGSGHFSCGSDTLGSTNLFADPNTHLQFR